MSTESDRLSTLQARLDELNARWDSGYALGPDRVLLNYERAIIAQQLHNEHEFSRTNRWPRTRNNKPISQQIRETQPPIRVRLWDCDTLIVPTSSKAFKVWLWETLGFIVTDPVMDWQADIARPGTAVLLKKGVANKWPLELELGVWVIDVDVAGTVFWCDHYACDPDTDVIKDAGDIIMCVKMVLESALSFKIIPTGESTCEVRRFCGAAQLAQQFDEARNIITQRWPTTKRLGSDTDVSFRGTARARAVAKPVAEEPVVESNSPQRSEVENGDRYFQYEGFTGEPAYLKAERDGFIVACRFDEGEPFTPYKQIERALTDYFPYRLELGIALWVGKRTVADVCRRHERSRLGRGEEENP